MKKIFVVTPFLAKYYRTETINNYVAQMASIARGYLQDEEIEVHTNFFLEPTGETEEDGTMLMCLRNSDNMLQYTIEELEEIAKCDAIFKLDWYPYIDGEGCVVTPLDAQLDKYFFGNSIPVYRIDNNNGGNIKIKIACFNKYYEKDHIYITNYKYLKKVTKIIWDDLFEHNEELYSNK